jgi:hypothetical protein
MQAQHAVGSSHPGRSRGQVAKTHYHRAARTHGRPLGYPDHGCALDPEIDRPRAPQPAPTQKPTVHIQIQTVKIPILSETNCTNTNTITKQNQLQNKTNYETKPITICTNPQPTQQQINSIPTHSQFNTFTIITNSAPQNTPPTPANQMPPTPASHRPADQLHHHLHQLQPSKCRQLRSLPAPPKLHHQHLLTTGHQSQLAADLQLLEG